MGQAVSEPLCCHPPATWICSLCGGAEATVTLMGGVTACGSCYSSWSLRVELAKIAALEDVRALGLAAMRARA